ncbi:MAG: TerB family tellurite resistance protein [Pseudomonadota bacterium]
MALRQGVAGWLSDVMAVLSPDQNGSQGNGTGSDREHALRVATAALMVDVARADHSFDNVERAAMLDLMAARFGLTPDECSALSDEGLRASDRAVSAYEFAQQLHERLEPDEKAEAVRLLWQVAYADGRLDRYENSVVLKISDLMFVPRGQVMRLKHDAAVAAGATPAEEKIDPTTR